MDSELRVQTPGAPKQTNLEFCVCLSTPSTVGALRTYANAYSVFFSSNNSRLGLSILRHKTGNIQIELRTNTIEMSNSLKICDARNLDGDGPTLILDGLTDRIAVRELIRCRVYREVNDYNHRKTEYFRGLVQPTDAEQTLNGYRMRKSRQIDWQRQFDRAIAAFQENGFVILVNDEQVTDLEDEIVVTAATTVTFLKLVPLVGG